MPDGSVAEKQASDDAKVGEIEQRDGSDGCALHGPGQWVPHVAQVPQDGVACRLWQLVWPILGQPPGNLSLRQTFVCALRTQVLGLNPI